MVHIHNNRDVCHSAYYDTLILIQDVAIPNGHLETLVSTTPLIIAFSHSLEFSMRHNKLLQRKGCRSHFLRDLLFLVDFASDCKCFPVDSCRRSLWIMVLLWTARTR